MKITIREINYKDVEVPHDITDAEIKELIWDGQIIVGDTDATDYEVKYSEADGWHPL